MITIKEYGLVYNYSSTEGIKKVTFFSFSNEGGNVVDYAFNNDTTFAVAIENKVNFYRIGSGEFISIGTYTNNNDDILGITFVHDNVIAILEEGDNLVFYRINEDFDDNYIIPSNYSLEGVFEIKHANKLLYFVGKDDSDNYFYSYYVIVGNLSKLTDSDEIGLKLVREVTDQSEILASTFAFKFASVTFEDSITLFRPNKPIKFLNQGKPYSG